MYAYICCVKYDEAKRKFIQAWGTMGTNWGINRTMAQIHALLLTAVEPLSTEDIMEELNISRGNANMNLRTLMDWGIVDKELKPGERREFFSTQKDVWQLIRHITRERKRREVDPVVKLLDELEDFEGGSTKEEKQMRKTLTEIKSYTKTASDVFDKVSKSDYGWFMKTLVKLMK